MLGLSLCWALGMKIAIESATFWSMSSLSLGSKMISLLPLLSSIYFLPAAKASQIILLTFLTYSSGSLMLIEANVNSSLWARGDLGPVALCSHPAFPISHISRATLTFQFLESDKFIRISEYDGIIITVGPLHMIPFAWNKSRFSLDLFLLTF